MPLTLPSILGETNLNVVPRAWGNGVSKVSVREVYCSAVVSGGVAVFDLTEDGNGVGPAIFNTVFKESANFWVDDANNQYQFGNYTVSENKKTLTITVNKLGSVLLGLIQIVTAANGTVVYMQVKGN